MKREGGKEGRGNSKRTEEGDKGMSVHKREEEETIEGKRKEEKVW